MKLVAKPIAYLSVVGGGLALHSEDGAMKFIVSISGTTAGISKEQNDKIASQIVDLINNNKGLDVIG